MESIRCELDHFPRLLKVYQMIADGKEGVTAKELSGHLGVNVRTVYRDIKELEQAGVPIWEEKTRYYISNKHFLPPLNLTVPEAIQIFLSLRLLMQFARRNSVDMASLFLKLEKIVPLPLQEEISKACRWMQDLPADPRLNRNLSLLAQAWITRSRAKIVYKSLDAETAASRIIEPYFIEPAASGRSCYVIAYCLLKKEIRTFKIERIQSVYVTEEHYTIPEEFDANRYLSPSLGIMVTSDELTIVELRFRQQISRIIEESVWHPSQKLEKKGDGSLGMTMEVNDTPELVNWILGWGDNVEVISPEWFRRKISDQAARMAAIYS
ncbi:MAG: WYL domain-containing protein [Dehalococcoidales bacterium]|jgi:predicted DNA-binding transcriptional regulator YafY|nr:WYL domain-containing protein [Dehalococcoidales bacterium]MDD4229777.1 WYL domain-containing protein [Dehalococcoidales bacterium]MDD4465791.1 WYL domain-containing protein [Dehalococcoidales bacterium]MDD5402467.1 WYL domain-containing protein [Dehalococcoidales bacterium]